MNKREYVSHIMWYMIYFARIFWSIENNRIAPLSPRQVHPDTRDGGEEDSIWPTRWVFFLIQKDVRRTPIRNWVDLIFTKP